MPSSYAAGVYRAYANDVARAVRQASDRRGATRPIVGPIGPSAELLAVVAAILHDVAADRVPLSAGSDQSTVICPSPQVWVESGGIAGAPAIAFA